MNKYCKTGLSSASQKNRVNSILYIHTFVHAKKEIISDYSKLSDKEGISNFTTQQMTRIQHFERISVELPTNFFKRTHI